MYSFLFFFDHDRLEFHMFCLNISKPDIQTVLNRLWRKPTSNQPWNCMDGLTLLRKSVFLCLIYLLKNRKPEPYMLNLLRRDKCALLIHRWTRRLENKHNHMIQAKNKKNKARNKKTNQHRGSFSCLCLLCSDSSNAIMAWREQILVGHTIVLFYKRKDMKRKWDPISYSFATRLQKMTVINSIAVVNLLSFYPQRISKVIIWRLKYLEPKRMRWKMKTNKLQPSNTLNYTPFWHINDTSAPPHVMWRKKMIQLFQTCFVSPA